MLHELLFNKKYTNKKVTQCFYDNLHFSPKLRRMVKREIKEIFLLAGYEWDENVLSENADPGDKQRLVALTSIAGRMQVLVSKIEERIKYNIIRRRRFSLYLNKSKTKALIELRFFHTGEGKTNIAGLVIRKKWGKENKMGGMRYARRVSKSGYELLDSGRYYRKLINWLNSGFSFRGKKQRIDMKIKYVNRKCKGFYVENPRDFPFFE